jgi:Mg-chelatase subunit ChlD
VTDSAAAPVHITIVLDRSGSMAAIADDVVGGFNAFLREQRETTGEARVTLVQFDTQGYDVVIDGADLSAVPDLDHAGFQPRGGTPLFDAVGQTIDAIDGRIAQRVDRDAEREDQVVAIITDGEENSSVRFRRSQVFAMIEERIERGWAFVFLGANQDAYAEGRAIGVVDGNIKQFIADRGGLKAAFGDLSVKTAEYRSAAGEARSHKAKTFFDDEENTGA